MAIPQNIQIREMTHDDLEDVLAIETASFPVPWTLAHFRQELESPRSRPIVAMDNGALVGYACISVLFDEAEILDIAVSPEARGRGVALSLMERGEQVARIQGASNMALEVRESNIAAISLYERIGFIRCGVRKKYYEGLEDAVLMSKKL